MKDRVRAFIERTARSGPDPEGFDALALALFAWQIQHNADYAAIAGDAQPQTPEEIPTVPVPLFRALPLTCFNDKHALYLFHTSGTTEARPGVHRLQNVHLYDLSALRWFERIVPDAPKQCLALIPSSAAAPHSSLAHMMGTLYPNARHYIERSGRMEGREMWADLAGMTSPHFIASTAFALMELLEHPSRRAIELPKGTMFMLTGGFKGRRVELSISDLHARIHEAFGPGVQIVGEYGMTELSSQLWRFDEAPYAPPPWMRVYAVVPATGKPLPAGQVGQLRFVDLANQQTVLAIETLDRGRVLSDGRVELLGRLEGAPARGCSLTREAAVAAAWDSSE